MNEFLDQVILSNPISAYLMVLGTILFVLLLKRLISKYFAKLLYKLVAKAAKNINRQFFLDLVIEPLEFFLVLFVSLVALDKLNFPEAINFKIYKVNFHQVVESFATATLIIVFIWLCIRIIEFIAMILEEKANLTKDQTDNQLIVFFKDFFKVILVIMGILLVLKFSFQKPIGNLLTGLSLVGAAVALATRESMENLIASFIIFFDKPFITGDLLKVSGFTGVVEKIGLRSTRIRTTDKTFISVPNKQMVDTIIDNLSLRTERRVELKLELGLNTPSEKLKATTNAIRNLLVGDDIINQQVYLMETGKNAHIISVEYFTQKDQTIEAFNQLRETINLQMVAYLETNSIEFAAASTDVKLVK